MRGGILGITAMAAWAWAFGAGAALAGLEADQLARLDRGNRQMMSGAPDSALAVARALVSDAGSGGGPELELAGQVLAAGSQALMGRPREAEAAARRALALSDSLAMPAPGRNARRWLGYALLSQGRNDEAAATYAGLRDDAQAAADPREEGYARMGLAYIAMRGGDLEAARAGYEQAAPLLRAGGETGGELDCLVGLARTLGGQGRFAEMTKLYRRIIREAEAADQARVLGFALNNLGAYEYQAGDPGHAVDLWEQALALQLKAGGRGTTPRMNLALARMTMGLYDEAGANLDELLAACRASGDRENEAAVLSLLASIRVAHGYDARATEAWRSIMAMDGAAGDTRRDAAIALVDRMARFGDPAKALALGDSLEQAGGLTANQAAAEGLATGYAALGCGRPGIALDRARRVAAAVGPAGDVNQRVDVLVLLARSERAVAEAGGAADLVDSARTHLERARREWNALRSVPRDPRWREQRSTLGGAVHAALADLLLNHPADLDPEARAAAAFDALQDYKARSLRERMAGPDRFGGLDDAAGVTLAELQASVLRPGEVLLDYYLGDRSRRGGRGVLFIVTPTSCRAAPLPDEGRLWRQVDLFLQLVVPGDGEGWQPAAASLGQALLGPAAPELAGARRVLIAADGWLSRAPFELLPWNTGDGAPALGEDRGVMRLPAATVLASLRARPATGGEGGAVVLEAAGGAVLPGAAAEVRSLQRHYGDITVLEPGCDAADGAWTGALASRRVLHIPAHTEAYDRRPWSSRIEMGQDDDGDPCWLRAADILELNVAADLVVLSGCSSGWGRIVSGEGVLGLTGAFLSAGSRAVVASLWDVDDAVAAAFMAQYYDALADGLAADDALAAARHALAARPGTAAPRAWAAFVLVGEGDQAVPLVRRSPLAGSATLGLLVILASLVVWLVISRRGRSLP